MAYPTSLDTFPDAAALALETLATSPHSTLHGNLGDAIEALEAKVGIDSSAVTSSHDYKLANDVVLKAATSTSGFSFVVDEDNMVSDSATKVPTQQSTKAYVDTASGLLIPKSLVDAKGDLLTATADNTPARLGVGANDTILMADSAQSTGLKWGNAATVRTALDVPTNAEAILDTLIDAKGDLIVGSAADTPARLAVGSNDQVLTADSSQSTGLKWATPSSSGGGPAVSILPSGALASTLLRNEGAMKNDPSVWASARLQLVAVYLSAGMSLSTITFIMGNTGLTGPSNQWFALFDSSRNKLAVTADDTSTAWSANAVKTLTISGGPYAISSSGVYYLGICYVTSSGGGNCTGVLPSVSNAKSLAPQVSGYADTGLSDPASCPSTAAALTSTPGIPYAYVS